MSRIKYIFFDCMETIIQLHELPASSDYALWAYSNSGVENYWMDFNEFLSVYEESKAYLSSIIDNDEEYEVIERIKYVVNRNRRISNEQKDDVIERLYNTYWDTYKSQFYIFEDTKEVLLNLSKNYKLAIISNFKVRNGIEELLRINKIDDIFDFIVTSINLGWRKPDSRIYEFAITQSNCRVDEIVFIGDDYVNDYVTPSQMGIKSYFLSKGKDFLDIETIIDFKDLERKLEVIERY